MRRQILALLFFAATAVGGTIYVDGVRQGTVSGSSGSTFTIGNAAYSAAGIDRPSALTTTFNVQNSGAGAMSLLVDGSEVLLQGAGSVGPTEIDDATCLQAVPVFLSTEITAVNYADITTPGGLASSEDAMDNFMAPVDLLAHSLRVESSVAPGVGKDAWIVSLRDDHADSGLTCTIDETDTSCTDSVHRASIAAGSKLDIKIDPTGPGSDPDTADLWIAFCFGQ